jgi:hypothetical protein
VLVQSAAFGPAPIASAGSSALQHLTPTGVSRLNLAERAFGLITEEIVPCVGFGSENRSDVAINRPLAPFQQHARSFRRSKSGADIKRGIPNAALIYDTRHEELGCLWLSLKPLQSRSTARLDPMR